MSDVTLKKNKTIVKRMEKSQILLIMAFAIVGIVAVIGLTIDVGIVFIEDSRLRRSVDSAALAAALQYRQGVPGTDLQKSASEFLLLNGIELDAGHPVVVTTCTEDADMCYDAGQDVNIPRKLVKVQASATVHLAFLQVIGIDTVPIEAEATGESASLDLVLILDRSESMTFDAPNGDALRDPSVCNNDTKVDALGWGGTDPYSGNDITTTDGMPGECHPFEEVKVAARNFLSHLYFPYDRVAIVTFDKTARTLLQFDEDCNPSIAGNTGGECESTDTAVVSAAIQRTIENVIKNISVYDADNQVCPNGQPCLPYCTQENIDAGYCNSGEAWQGNWIAQDDPNAVYAGHFDCGNGYAVDADPLLDPSQCTTTNIASGLYAGGSAFAGSATSHTAIRTSSLWVVVLLTDGAATSGTYNDEAGTPACPLNTWDPSKPFCRDVSSLTRHCANSATFDTCSRFGNGLPGGLFQHGVMDPADYDADDAAHDAADFVGFTQKATVFAIGLGPQVHTSDEAGYRLLKYAAEVVGNGSYYDAPNTAELNAIFKAIGDKIATRLAH